MKVNNEIQIPVIATPTKKACEVLIPDLNLKVEGRDLVEALALSISYVSAIYYYNIEHNCKFDLNTTYEQAESMCKSKHSFVTYIGLVK